jgi:hypothetical protein
MTDAASDNISAPAAARDARGRFQPGCSGNPAGKSRARSTARPS